MKRPDGVGSEEVERLFQEARENLVRAKFVLNAMRGREVKEGASKAGRQRKGQRKADHVTDDELQDEVQALQDQGETRTNACRRVGRRLGIPLSTMLRRTRPE